MKRIATLASAIAIATPGTALAQESATCQGYHPETNCAPPSTIATTPPTNDGTLPFTGLDIGLLAVGGGTLLGTGFVVRRLSRRLD